MVKHFVTNLVVASTGALIPISVWATMKCGAGTEGFIFAAGAMVIAVAATKPTHP